MAKRVKAIVDPAFLIWAREGAGYDINTAAKKVQVKPEQVESWERGESGLTVKQLRRLAKVYRRPLAVFYLPEPPTDFQALNDYRRLPGEVAGYLSPALRYEMRQVQNRRELALELFESTEGEPPTLPLIASLTDRPERLADTIRHFLGISYEEQTRWRTPYDAFNGWRASLETAGLLVFQVQHVEAGEMRGMSISDTPLSAIVVNIKDSVNGRIFSMIHELVHLMLRKGGVCDLREDYPRPPEEQQIEIFCNAVAGATLVPREHLLHEEVVVTKDHDEDWTDDEIRFLSNRYGVSQEALLRRLLICDMTTEAFYQRKREQYREEFQAHGALRERGFPPPHRIVVSSAGRLFVRLVLTSYHQEKITASDVADFLEVRLKHLRKIEADIFGNSFQAGVMA